MHLLDTANQVTELLRGRESDPLFLATALALAFFFGAVHALSPGHGKTLVAAYLVGSRGRLADAFYLGGVVTATHTVSVFVLGLGTLYASTRVSLDRILPQLSLMSGVLVLVFGLWLSWSRLRGAPGGPVDHSPTAAHAHGVGISHGHSHGGLLSLGVAGGMAPCSEALVLLMLSVSLGRLGLGLLLLAAFTLGLAAVLVAIGSAMVLAGGRFSSAGRENAWVRRLPLVSAAVVTLLGAMMTVEALRKIHG